MKDKPEYSIEVEERIGLSDKVIIAITTHAPQVGKTLNTIFNAIPNTPPIEWIHVLLAQAGYLQFTTDLLGAADLAHSLEMTQDDKARQAKERALKVAYDGAVSTRRILQGLFGDENLELMGFKGSTFTKAESLYRQLADVCKKVDDMRPWPESPPDAPSWTKESVIKRVDGLAAPLKAAMDAVIKDVQESKATMAAKWAAMEEHNRVYVRVAQIAIALFSLAKEDVLAARIRPTLPVIPPMPVVVEPPVAEPEANNVPVIAP